MAEAKEDGNRNFYSHTPHGVQRKMAQSALNTTDFYSHTPHGVQRWKKIIVYPVLAFLLTHPSRGATRPIRNQPLHWSFLLTHPSRGATAVFAPPVLLCGISTHTPLTGCNNEVQSVMLRHKDFYSHTPCGVQRMPISHRK